MISNKRLLSSMLLSLAVALLSACGGGAGSAVSNEFTNNNTNTKPQASSADNTPISSALSSIARSNSSQATAGASSSTTPKSNSSSSVIDIAAPSIVPEITLMLNEYDLIVFSWTAATDNVGVTSYKIYRNQVQINEIDAIDTTYVDFNVAPNSTYTYGISTGDAVGNWSPVKTIIAKTQPIPTPISSASSSTSTSTSTSVNASSSSSSNNSTSSSSKNTSASSNNSSSSSSKNSSSSTSSSVDTIAPSAPGTISQILTSSNLVDIGWIAATDNIGVTAYRIYRDSTLLTTVDSTTLAYSDNTALAAKTYTYKVEARDAAGNWSLPRTIVITTPLPSPIGDVTLYWAPPTERDDGSTLTTAELGGFLIRYKSKAETNYTFIDINDGSAKSRIIANISTDYDIQIAAYDSNQLYSAFVPILPK
jgi:chitodextrinase